jgi:hydrogenase expression/formation protein HypE
VNLTPLPVGKLPPDLLARLLGKIPNPDPRLVLGPGIGLDCAVIDPGGDLSRRSRDLLVLKSDPITFATEAIGWYAVQVNANDIATHGATPRWMLATLLLPEGSATAELAEEISQGLVTACSAIEVTLAGGHTEITHGLDRPILIGTMIGEVPRERLITPRGAAPGDRLLVTKGVPIEATAILAREVPERLVDGVLEMGEIPFNSQGEGHSTIRQPGGLSLMELESARNFLYDPGISVLSEARIATESGRVHAMHDPTEGGLYSALWELAEASGCSLLTDLTQTPIPPMAQRVCARLGLDPLGAIASGALLIAAHPDDANSIRAAIQAAGIECAEIGEVLEQSGQPNVWKGTEDHRELVPRPAQDEIARLFES